MHKYTDNQTKRQRDKGKQKDKKTRDRQRDRQTDRQSLPPDESLSDFISGQEKIQKQSNFSQTNFEITTLLEEAPTGCDSARLRSLQGNGAGAWINAVPTSQSFALNSCKYRLTSSARLGLPIFPNFAEKCDHGAATDSSGYHLITCKTGGGPVWSQKSMARYGRNASEIFTYLIARSREIDIQIVITNKTLQFLMHSLVPALI